MQFWCFNLTNKIIFDNIIPVIELDSMSMDFVIESAHYVVKKAGNWWVKYGMSMKKRKCRLV